MTCIIFGKKANPQCGGGIVCRMTRLLVSLTASVYSCRGLRGGGIGEMSKVGYMMGESYVCCRGYVLYRSLVQHLSVCNPPSVAINIRPQCMEKTMAKLKMFRMGEMELKDVAASDGNRNVFKSLPPITLPIGTNELHAPDCAFWMNRPVQFLNWGCTISASSLRELFCCDVGTTSSCLTGRFIPPDVISNVLTELITLYNRARRGGLEFIAVAAGYMMQLGDTVHQPTGRYTPTLLCLVCFV